MPKPAKITGRFSEKAAKEQKVRELYGQGMTVKQIIAQTGVSKATIYRWLNLGEEQKSESS